MPRVQRQPKHHSLYRPPRHCKLDQSPGNRSGIISGEEHATTSSIGDKSFFTRHIFPMDIMHHMDCKGVASIVFGSLLMYAIRDPQFGANQGSRIDRINAELRSWYDARPGSNRLPSIRISDITKEGWGDLHGPAIKAAMTRQAAPFFADFAQRFFSADRSAYEGHMVDVTRDLDAFYKVFEGQGMFMSPASVRKLSQICQRFGSSIMHLRNLARDQNLLAWQVTTKVHKTQHLPMMSRLLNPRLTSCSAH